MLDPVDFSVGYREWAPPAALRDVLACLWTRVVPGGTGPGGTGPGGPGPRASLVLPDGCTDLIWERGSGAFVAGPDTGPVPTLLAPGTVFVGVRFRPGAGGGALGVPLSELRDLRVGLADVRRDVVRQLPASLEPADAVGALVAVAGRLAAERPPDPAMLQACRLLGRPGVRTEDVADQVGLSGRQFRRRSEAAVGYGPKMLQRVLRFRRFVSLVDSAGWTPGWAAGGPAGGPASLAQAAVDSGYADQPHLTRETARLAGLSPAALVRERAGPAF
jgi:AraC-like DNA-binding protein